MIFKKIFPDARAFIIDITPYEDFRGIFARTVCRDEFATNGLSSNFVQQSLSFNPKVGTLRGMHWQEGSYAEEKLVRVTRGAVFDVIVDIRPESKLFKNWFGTILSEENRRQIYIPKGFAHGFQTTEPNTEVLYEMTAPYDVDSSRGFLWNDPAVGIQWPEIEYRVIGVRDSNYQNL